MKGTGFFSKGKVAICIILCLSLFLSACGNIDIDTSSITINDVKSLPGDDFSPKDEFDTWLENIQNYSDSVMPSSVPEPTGLYIEPLSYSDYEKIFSSDNSYNWKFAYWTPRASFDVYEPDFDKATKAMQKMGFNQIEFLEFNNDEIKVFYGLKELDTPIEEKNILL